MIPRIASRRALITGIGTVNAIACSQIEFVDALRKRSSGLRPIASFDAQGMRCSNACEAVAFDADTVAARRGGKRMERSSALVLSAFDEALKMSGLAPSMVMPQRGAVAFGTTLGGSRVGFDFYRSATRHQRRRPSLLRDYSLHAPGYRICIETGFMGANLVYSTACTSSNLAVAMALELIRSNQADVVVVGGFDTMSQVTCAGFGVMRNVSPDLCRPFDRNRKGLVLGEGAAVMVIEAEDFAARRGAQALAVVMGYGITSDAHHMTAPDVTAASPAACMNKALYMGRVSPAEVDLICAHGTGTQHNDAIEAKALHIVLGEAAKSIPCVSIKSAVGHTLGAAGAMNIAAALAARAGQFIPATLNFQEPDEAYALNCSAEVRAAKPRFVLSNALGFGGANCSLLLELK
jgi:3-oxoacyl-(acyl-carrier-protein) synthase